MAATCEAQSRQRRNSPRAHGARCTSAQLSAKSSTLYCRRRSITRRANVLEPDTKASGDVYELYGASDQDVNVIPIEFYTLEPHREHVFFADRDQLQSCLENPATLFKAFKTAPLPISNRASVFVVKGEQLLNLQPQDWIARETHMSEFPGLFYPAQQALLVQRYIEQQSDYPFLKAIEDGLITSQGILLTRYFPSPLMKRHLAQRSGPTVPKRDLFPILPRLLTEASFRTKTARCCSILRNSASPSSGSMKRQATFCNTSQNPIKIQGCSFPNL